MLKRVCCNNRLLLLLKFAELSARTVPKYPEKSQLQPDDLTASPSVPHAQASTCDIPAVETEGTRMIRGLEEKYKDAQKTITLPNARSY